MRAAIAFLLVTALLALPMPWVPPGVRSALALSAAGTLMMGLLFLAGWVLEKLSRAPYEPFNPHGRRDTTNADAKRGGALGAKAPKASPRKAA